MPEKIFWGLYGGILVFWGGLYFPKEMQAPRLHQLGSVPRDEFLRDHFSPVTKQTLQRVVVGNFLLKACEGG